MRSRLLGPLLISFSNTLLFVVETNYRAHRHETLRGTYRNSRRNTLARIGITPYVLIILHTKGTRPCRVCGSVARFRTTVQRFCWQILFDIANVWDFNFFIALYLHLYRCTYTSTQYA